MKRGLVVDREAQMIGVYILESGEIYRGFPRKKVLKKTKIYAGDYVLGEIVDKNTFTIEEVEERKNFLKRPPVANVDKVMIVATIKFPDFDNFLIDNLLAVYEYLKSDPIIVFNKIDLLDNEGLKELNKWVDIYINAGYDVLKVSANTGEGIQNLKDYLSGTISVFAGASGVGKSSILSKLIGVELETRDISRKLKRGRHTTTGVKLFPFGDNSFVGDTPGFSNVDALYFMDKKEVKDYFREFLRYSCKYPNCLHINEPQCGVKEAVERGEIALERYKSYLRIVNSEN